MPRAGPVGGNPRATRWTTPSPSSSGPATPAPELAELDDLPPLPPPVRELVLDRVDAALREGLLDLSAESYSALLCAIMPDEFEVPPLPTTPTGTVPMTRDRVRVYAARVRAEVSIFHAGDAAGDGERRGIRPQWDGGSDPKAAGWQEESAAGQRTRGRRERRDG
jgi:hypothetical protein